MIVALNKVTSESEFSVLRQIKDNYPKYVVTMDTLFGRDFEGIQRLNMVDLLLIGGRCIDGVRP